MDTYRIDISYYGKVEYTYEYTDKKEAHHDYWYYYHNGYGAVELYVNGVKMEKEEDIINALGPKPRKGFTII